MTGDCPKCGSDKQRLDESGRLVCGSCGEPLEAAPVAAQSPAPLTQEAPPAELTPLDRRMAELKRLFGRSRPPTLALVGASTVGKTFFYSRLELLALRKGWGFGQLTDGDGDRDLRAGRPWEQKVESTGHINVYSLRPPKGLSLTPRAAQGVWIIDMPGETFRKAQGGGFDRPDLPGVEDFWLILAAADALLLMTPACESLIDTTRDPLHDIARGIRPLAAAVSLLEKELKAANGDRHAALERLCSLDREQLSQAFEEVESRCRKPLLLLLSKADLLFCEVEDPAPDRDPACFLAERSPEVFAQLCSWFDNFKVDFVTSCGGAASTIFDRDKPDFAVWDAALWARTLSTRRLRMPTRYVTAVRQRIDREFRQALQHG